MKITLESMVECPNYNGSRKLKVGDVTWYPADSSDPAGCVIIAILQTLRLNAGEEHFLVIMRAGKEDYIAAPNSQCE